MCTIWQQMEPNVQVFTMVQLKILFFWYMTLCQRVIGSKILNETCYIHFHGLLGPKRMTY